MSRMSRGDFRGRPPSNPWIHTGWKACLRTSFAWAVRAGSRGERSKSSPRSESGSTAWPNVRRRRSSVRRPCASSGSIRCSWVATGCPRWSDSRGHRRPRSSGREVSPRGASRGRDGFARCRGVDALRLRSRSDPEGGARRDRDTLVDGPACGASQSDMDRGWLELLQPTWAPARRRTGDPRAHRAARSLSETAGSGGGSGELMAKLYTRRGDAGETGLLGPERVSNDDPRIEAMGTVGRL